MCLLQPSNRSRRETIYGLFLFIYLEHKESMFFFRCPLFFGHRLCNKFVVVDGHLSCLQSAIDNQLHVHKIHLNATHLNEKLTGIGRNRNQKKEREGGGEEKKKYVNFIISGRNLDQTQSSICKI